MDARLLAAYRFFRENAGGRVGYSAVTAMDLAKAERYAEENGWTYKYGPEMEPWDGYEPLPKGCALRCVILYNADGDILESLGMVAAMPGDPYWRVVAAELASKVSRVSRRSSPVQRGERP